MNQHPSPYDPSEADIAAECAYLQAGWSPQARQKRTVCVCAPVTAEVVHVEVGEGYLSDR